MVFPSKVLYAKRVGGRTISAKVAKIEKGIKPRRKKRWYMRWWAWCIWVLLLLVLILMAVGLWAWTQRYDLMESRAIKVFSEAGFEAELDIVSITGTQAQINDIKLRRAHKEVLRIESLRAEYVWPDVRDGRLIQLDLSGVSGRLELGEDWRPTEDWVKTLLPEGTGGGDGGDPVTGIFEKGIGLSDGRLTLVSPLGEQTFAIDADIETSKSFKAKITLPLSDISYAGVSAKGSGLVTIQQTGGDEIQFQGQTQTCLLYTSPSPRDKRQSRMPSSA